MDDKSSIWSAARDFGAVALICLAGALVLTVFIGPASAGGWDEPGGYGGPVAIQRSWSACRADARHFCGDVVPGGGRILACLAGNRDRLTPDCRAVIRHAQALYGR